jgi:EAL domain-containing protein (putative c-di-GMP-specific phosphodiesterase class I)
MKAVVNLAHDLNRRVIAEGVETGEQLSLIQQCGCDEVQGYLLGRPTANPDQYLSTETARELEITPLAPPADFQYGAGW